MTVIKLMIAYYRVSDKKQGDGKESGTGYGMDAQERMVENLRRQHGATVIDSYTEVETATNKRKRPKLAAALAKCRETGATLVIAKLDRLARNVYFIAGLMEACKTGVPFICCDMPTAEPVMIHVMSAFAEHEAKIISARTKAGLESARLKGKLLGSARPGHWEGREHLRCAGLERSTKDRYEESKAYYAYLFPQIALMRSNGDTLETIVAWLNSFKHKTQKNKPYNVGSLQRIMARYMDPENTQRAPQRVSA